MFDFQGVRPKLIKSIRAYQCFGCGEHIFGEAVHVEDDVYLCGICYSYTNLPPICSPVDQYKKQQAEFERQRIEQERLQAEYEARFCCSGFRKLCHSVIFVNEEGQTTNYGTSDGYTEWEERNEELDFKSCPYCQKPFKPVQTA